LPKQEETLFSPALPDPVRLPAMHPARRLRRAHPRRGAPYSISFTARCAGNNSRVPGSKRSKAIGPATAKLLLKKFGSMKRTADAAPEEIAKVKGITLEKAVTIKCELEKIQAGRPNKKTSG
jgi:excinuclease ABC subunit C